MESLETHFPHQIKIKARKRLEARMLAFSRNIILEYKEGVMTLKGHLPSFYHKQIAQETIRRIEGIQQIVNKIEVKEKT